VDNDDPAKESPRGVISDEALRSLVSNLVYLAVMLGFTVAISKRDALARLHMRYRQVFRQDARKAAYRRALAELRREISELEHGGPERPAAAPETRGGMYGPR
jgi:hypothetical protein